MRPIASSFILFASSLILSSAIGQAANAEELSSLVGTCVACHGTDGVSPGAAWPSLAGQKRGYLEQQMKDFRDGNREEPTMTAFVTSLTDEQIGAIASYYADLPRPGNAASDTNNKAGERVRANCLSCHGVHGFTVNETWPNLAGQNSAYLLRQLQAFRDGSRKSPIMNVIANELTEQQMRDVAEYYSQRAY